MNTRFAIQIVAAATALCASAVQANGLWAHPALGGAVAAGAVQAQAASPIGIGHPASPSWADGHANHHHPAVVSAVSARKGFDTNTFLVQPPSTVTWTLAPESEQQFAKAPF